MINNELQVRLLHAAKDRTGWKQTNSTPKVGEVCLEAFEDPNNSLGHVFKIKIGDNHRKFCRYIGSSTATPPPLTPEEDWDFTSSEVLPYFGTVVTASGNAQVVEFYTYPNDYSADISLQNVTVMRIYELNLSYSSGSGSGETAINLSVDTTTFKEIRPGSNISFTSSNSGALLTIAANMDFSSLDVTEYAQVEWDSANNQIKIYGIKEVGGKISRGASFKSLKVSSPLTISNTDNIITFGIQNATTQQKGAVRLLDTYTSSNASDNTFATTNAAITSAIASLDGTATTSNTDNSKDVIVTVTESNGIVSSTKKTVTEGDKITISTPTTGANAGKMIISHEESNTVVTDNSSNKNERETNIITDVTIDDYGHVTAYTKDKSTNLIAADIRASVTKTDDTTWNYRETGGEISIGEDIARVSKLKGNTIVWNQILDYNNLNSSLAGFTTKSVDNNGILTLTVTVVNQYAYSWIKYVDSAYNDHVLYIKVDSIEKNYSGNPIYLYYWENSSEASAELTQGVPFERIVKKTSTGYLGIRTSFTNGTVGDTYKLRLQVFDLTKMLGSDDAIKAALGVSTLEGQDLVTAATNFEKLFPNSYYPYCAGRLVNLGGYGVKWNQLVQNGNFIDTTNWSAGSGGSLSISGGVATLTKSATGTATYTYLNHSVNYVEDHKYLVLAYVKSNNSGSRVRVGIGSNSTGAEITQYTYYADWTRLTLIGEYNSESSGSKTVSFRIYNDLDPNQNVSASFKNVMCIDLTMMFGPGSEPTLEEFEAMFPDDYYEYNEGTEMNIFDAADGENKLGLESTGFNLWDGTGVLGRGVRYTDGDIISASACIATDFIHVVGNQDYYTNVTDIGSSVYGLAFYDINKNYIDGIRSGGGSWSNMFHTPDGCAYIRLTMLSTQKDTAIINISSSRNGEYEPYKKDTLDLDWVRNIEYTPDGSSTPEKLFPQGLLSAGSVYDEVGENYAIKRVGVVDLGAMSWTFNNAQVFQSRSLGTIGYNALCKKYLFAGKADGNAHAYGKGNLSLSIYTGGDYRIYIRDDSYSDEETFKNSLSGVILYYELATPVVVYFDEKKKLNYFVDDHGTEQQLPVNGSSVITSPFVGTFEYKSNFKDAVIDLIDKANAYKNPVKSKDNVSQTVGKFATYDTSYTVHSSEYQVKNNPFEGAETNITLPTAEQIIEYVNTQIASSLTYKGVVSGLTGSTSGKIYFSGISNPSSGDLYFLGNLDSPATSMTVDATASSTYHIAEGTYYPGTMFIWNANTVGSEHWDAIAGTTTVSDNDPILWVDTATPDSSGHKQYTVGSVEGHDLHVTVPTIEEISGKKAVGQVLVGNGTGENNNTASWRGLKLDETVNKDNTPIGGTNTGLLERYNDGSLTSPYQWRFADTSAISLVNPTNSGATAGKVLVGKYNASSETHTTPPSWENLKLDDTYEITNLGSGDSKVGYLKRKVTSGTGVTPVTYGWELDPYGGGDVMPYKSNSDGTGDVATSSKTTAQINSLPTSSEKVLARTALREQVGTDTYVYHKISVGALENDSNIVLVLNGNFS